jgi:transcriptional regulator with XRE-family HTH domain
MADTILLITPIEVGALIRSTRKARNLRLEDLSLAAGVGVRFLSELERGKSTARLGETLRVLAALGIRISAQEPDDALA